MNHLPSDIVTKREIGDRRPPVEQASLEKDLAVIRSQLEDAKFKNAYNTGRRLTIEQAIALALES